MKIISIAELKRRLSAHLRTVKAGGELIVTDRGHPVAKVVPLRDEELGVDARMKELVRKGLARPPITSFPKDFWEQRRPADPDGRVMKALLDEREHGR